MKKNDIIKVNVRRQIITPKTSKNQPVGNISTEVKTLDVVVDSVGKSIIKGHYLNDSDGRYLKAEEYFDMDNMISITEYVVVRVEIDRKTEAVYEYKVFADEEADYHECEKLIEEAKKQGLKKGSNAWWGFMGRAYLTTAHPSVYAWTTEKKADGVLVA